MRNLAAPRTNLKGFLSGLGSLASALAPVSHQQAELYTNLDTTFKALAGVAKPYLQDWIAQTPPTFQAVISDGPQIGSFATDTAQLFADLKPGFATLPDELPRSLPRHSRPGSRRCPAPRGLDRQTVGALDSSLYQFGADSTVQGGALAAGAGDRQPQEAAAVPGTRTEHLQLRDAVPAQPRQLAVRQHRHRHACCASCWSRSTTTSPAARPRRRARRTRRPRRPAAPSTVRCTSTPTRTPHRPVELAECSRRQGAVLAEPGSDRQPEEERRDRDREDDEERLMSDAARSSRSGATSRGSPTSRRRSSGSLVIAIVCYLVFGGGLPFGGSGFTLKAVFTSNTDLHIPSPVRIAGVRRRARSPALSGSTAAPTPASW